MTQLLLTVRRSCHTDAKVAEEYELTRDKISKYCRLATLYRPLLLLLDESKKIGQLAAYEISFIENSTRKPASTK